ncbi:MAG TPA: hypothetical protein VKD72_38140 [Gemmataceae bacterium]|nr:hypothetical protein [Gemmataceae bacterium]
MFLRKINTGIALAVGGLFLAGSAVLVQCAVARPPAQTQVDKDPKTSGVAFSDAEFKELKAKLDIKNQPWASIPWKYSLTEARELAAKSKKPIFMVVNTGNVLGCV